MNMGDGSWGQPCGPSLYCFRLFVFFRIPSGARWAAGRGTGDLATWKPGDVHREGPRLPVFQAAAGPGPDPIGRPRGGRRLAPRGGTRLLAVSCFTGPLQRYWIAAIGATIRWLL